MIQSLTYRGRLDGGDGAAVAADINERIDKLTSMRPMLLGGAARVDGNTIGIRLRLSGLDRWKLSHEGAKIATFLMNATHLTFTRPVQVELIVTEPTRNKLRVGEGRTPMVRPPRRFVSQD
jgi:hypothetical protein